MSDKKTIFVKAKGLPLGQQFTIVPGRHPLDVEDHGPDYKGDVTYVRAPAASGIQVNLQPTAIEVFDERHLELLKTEPNIVFCDEAEAQVESALKEEEPKAEESKSRLFGKKK